MLKYLRRHIWELLTIIFLLAVGVLLLVDPATFAAALIRVVGVALAIFGIWRVIRYFRTPADLAAQGTDFFTGLMAVCLGILCVVGTRWFMSAFPILAVFYGLLQILLGFQKVQRTVDALRMGLRFWYLPAIGALISLLFGFLIVLNPGMALMSVWTFTGITLIVEGLYDAVALWMMRDRVDQHYVSAGPGSFR